MTPKKAAADKKGTGVQTPASTFSAADLDCDLAQLGEPEADALLARLRSEVSRHDYLYYVESRPELSDDEYDRAYKRLKAVEEAFPHLISPDSPTQRVAGELQQAFEKITHAMPMLSLDSTASEADVVRFDERVRKAVEGAVRYVLEPKLDGASIELVYERGRLARAVTRGNGREGEAVTANVRTIRSVPLELNGDVRPVPTLLSVRGEVMMLISAFERFNEKLVARGEEPYASPRNSASGAIRQLDPKLTAERELTCLAYDVMLAEGVRIQSDFEGVKALADWGFKIPDNVEVTDTAEGILEYHRRWNEQRDDLDYEIDGVVVKLDSLDARADMGTTAHHPRWAFAYKFQPRREVTRVEKIMVSVGRTGVLTPVALLLPVVVGGVTISRASLHNREEVQRKDVREGDLVRIQRAGDVIPQVVERVDDPTRERGEPFAMPETCPACGSHVEEKGPFTICPNRFGCPAQLVGRVVHFGSRGALDVEGLGGETASLLVERGIVKELADLFTLTREHLIGLPGFADKNATRLVDGIQARRTPDLARFLHALGIPEVGGAVARDLAMHFRDARALMDADEAALTSIPGIGPKMSEAIRDFFANPENRSAIENILAHVAPVAPAAPTASGLSGKKFVFTGGLSRMSRGDAKKLVEANGARVVGSVSKETDYVVVGEDPGSKADKAVELGVTTLDEDGFIELLRGAGIVPPV
jgi:DNA ligase (NAD+)